MSSGAVLVLDDILAAGSGLSLGRYEHLAMPSNPSPNVLAQWGSKTEERSPARTRTGGCDSVPPYHCLAAGSPFIPLPPTKFSGA